MKNVIYIAICGTFLFLSCKKQNNTINNSSSQSEFLSTPPSGYDYESKYDSVLKAATYGLIDILPTYSYRQIINSEVS